MKRLLWSLVGGLTAPALLLMFAVIFRSHPLMKAVFWSLSYWDRLLSPPCHDGMVSCTVSTEAMLASVVTTIAFYSLLTYLVLFVVAKLRRVAVPRKTEVQT